MHVLVMPSFYPSTIRPTTGIFFQDQVKALRYVGHTVGVLIAPRLYETLGAIRQRRRFPPRMEPTDDEQTYRLHSLWVPRFFPHVSSAIYRRAVMGGFKDYLAQYGKPDVIHAHNIFYGGDMAVTLSQVYDIPVVLTEHSSNFLRGRVFLPAQQAIARQTLHAVDYALAVGQPLADYLSHTYALPRTVQTIGNVVDTDYFVPDGQADEFIVAAVGQLRDVKRFDLLIRAFTQAFRGQVVRLQIGGHGKEYHNLQQLITSLDMAGQIDLLGHLSRDEVRMLFQRASVVVSSSQIETFGITLIEAMSCGTPVIATRSGGPQQFITDATGLLVEVNDEPALVDALQRMKVTYDQYDSHAIRDYCVAQFSNQAIGDQLTAIYQQVTSPSSHY